MIPCCCPEPCLCPLAATVAVPRQQHGTLSFQAGVNQGTAQEGEQVRMLEPWQCPEHPWCHWQWYGQGDKYHLPGTANPGSIAQWEGGQCAVLEELSWWSRDAMGEREL